AEAVRRSNEALDRIALRSTQEPQAVPMPGDWGPRQPTGSPIQLLAGFGAPAPDQLGVDAPAPESVDLDPGEEAGSFDSQGSADVEAPLEPPVTYVPFADSPASASGGGSGPLEALQVEVVVSDPNIERDAVVAFTSMEPTFLALIDRVLEEDRSNAF